MSTLLDNLRARWDETTAQLQTITQTAADGNRDMNDVERANFAALREQLSDLEPRITDLVEVERSLDSTAGLFASVSREGRGELTRHEAPSLITQYESPGHYLHDVMRAFGPGADTAARQRVRQVATVQRATTINGATVEDVTLDDLVGIVPEPIVGSVWDSIDASRRVTSTLTQRAITAPLMFRPKVSQHTLVGPQGTAGLLGSLNNTGATVDEKKAFVSRDMKLVRIDIEPIALGGVVDVSLWAEMLSPGLLNMIVSDLAQEYAIQTEAVSAAAVEAAATTSAIDSIVIGPDTLNGAIYEAAAAVYAATGRMATHVGMSVDVWALLGGMVDGNDRPLFPALGPSNANGTMNAGSFAGGELDGLRKVVSPAFSPGTLLVYSATDFEAFERRLGVLQVIEPERAGRVVSYSGLFTAIAMDDGAAAQIPYTTV